MYAVSWAIWWPCTRLPATIHRLLHCNGLSQKPAYPLLRTPYPLPQTVQRLPKDGLCPVPNAMWHGTEWPPIRATRYYAEIKVGNRVVLKTTGCWRLFFKFSPVGGGGKFFNNR